MRLSTEGMAKEIQELKSLNTRIELENLRMREALEFIAAENKVIKTRDGVGSMRYWYEQECKSRDSAHKALQAIPHTERLAKQREADLRVIEAAKAYVLNDPSRKDYSDLWNKVTERERIYKGEI